MLDLSADDASGESLKADLAGLHACLYETRASPNCALSLDNLAGVVRLAAALKPCATCLPCCGSPS